MAHLVMALLCPGHGWHDQGSLEWHTWCVDLDHIILGVRPRYMTPPKRSCVDKAMAPDHTSCPNGEGLFPAEHSCQLCKQSGTTLDRKEWNPCSSTLSQEAHLGPSESQLDTPVTLKCSFHQSLQATSFETDVSNFIAIHQWILFPWPIDSVTTVYSFNHYNLQFSAWQPIIFVATSYNGKNHIL